MADDGCLTFLGVAGFALSVFLFINNVEPIVIQERVPPPQEDWTVVYPQFRDDVSSQLRNTQELVGIAIRDTEYLQAQNAELQDSLNLLLSELGLAQKKYQEESRKQRTEQWFLTAISIVLGWILSIFLPPEKVTRFFRKESKGLQVSNGAGKVAVDVSSESISFREPNHADPINRLLAYLFVIFTIILVVLIVTYFYLS